MRNRNKLVYGVGINDADYNTSGCGLYSLWQNMLRRGFSLEFKIKYPTYTDVTVCEEWKTFTKFKSWFDSQINTGLHLDKDILFVGNTIYSPENCVFVPCWVNSCLIITTQKKTTGLPIGVSTQKDRPLKNYKGFINANNSRVYLGRFERALDAHKAWQWAKAEYIEGVVHRYASEECFRTDVAEALTQRVWKLRLDYSTGAETLSL